MPYWCETWGSSSWIFPLLGLVVMGVMAVACLRGFGCMGWRSGAPGDVAELRREIQALKEEIGKLSRSPR